MTQPEYVEILRGDQSTWPAHLREDAPYQRCGRCLRATWSVDDFDSECRMTQPDGYPCGGRFADARTER